MKDIAIRGDIAHTTLAYIEKILPDLQKDRHILHINSKGGDINSAVDTSLLLLSLGEKIISFGHEHVASSALLIHQSCLGDRIATPSTRFLLHRVKPPIGTVVTTKHIKSEFLIFTFYAKMTGRTVEEIYGLAAKNKDINATEALEFGFITKIVEHPFPVI